MIPNYYHSDNGLNVGSQVVSVNIIRNEYSDYDLSWSIKLATTKNVRIYNAMLLAF